MRQSIIWRPWVRASPHQEHTFNQLSCQHFIYTSTVDEKYFSTRMKFELTRAEPIGLAVQRLNHSATSSLWQQFLQNIFFHNSFWNRTYLKFSSDNLVITDNNRWHLYLLTKYLYCTAVYQKCAWFLGRWVFYLYKCLTAIANKNLFPNIPTTFLPDLSQRNDAPVV